MTCSGMDTCCQGHMRYTLLDPNRADKYQEDSLALYVYLSNAIEIYWNEKGWFLYTFTKSIRILPKVIGKMAPKHCSPISLNSSLKIKTKQNLVYLLTSRATETTRTNVTHGWMGRLWLAWSPSAYISSMTWRSSATQCTWAIAKPSYRAWVTLRSVGNATLIMEGSRWAGFRICPISAKMSRRAGVIQVWEWEVHVVWVVHGQEVFFWRRRLWSLSAVVATITVAGWPSQAFSATELSSWTIRAVSNCHQT